MAYEYDASRPRVLTKAGDVSLAYDLEGRVTRRGSLFRGYDARGRLAVLVAPDVPSEQHEYSADGEVEVVRLDGRITRIDMPGLSEFWVSEGRVLGRTAALRRRGWRGVRGCSAGRYHRDGDLLLAPRPHGLGPCCLA